MVEIFVIFINCSSTTSEMLGYTYSLTISGISWSTGYSTMGEILCDGSLINNDILRGATVTPLLVLIWLDLII